MEKHRYFVPCFLFAKYGWHYLAVVRVRIICCLYINLFAAYHVDNYARVARVVADDGEMMIDVAHLAFLRIEGDFHLDSFAAFEHSLR